MYLDSESDGENDTIDTFNLAAILKGLGTRYPDTNFQQYEGMLRTLGITYLDITARFETSWYTNPAKVNMSEGDATLFCGWVMKEIQKRDREKRRVRDTRKGKKKARVSYPDDQENQNKEKENVPPIASSSRQ